MRERSILFSAPMVKAILASTKTQTRRLATHRHGIEFLGGKGQEGDPAHWGYAFDGPEHHGYAVLGRGLNERHDHGSVSIPSPYGEAGDRLWVKETWRTAASLDGKSPTQIATQCTQEAGYSKPWAPLVYEADGERRNWTGPEWGEPGKTRVSIHMPRWASRITLEVTSVRVERITDITEDDAKAEGVTPLTGLAPEQQIISGEGRTQGTHPYTLALAVLWDTINDKDGCRWVDRPWVWVIGFKRLEAA